MKEYYIISLKHTSKGDTALTFWGKNGGGYTWNRERAGLYPELGIEKYTSEDNIAVPKEQVDPFWMNALDFNDKYISVPNNPTVRHHLGLNGKFMKPKSIAACKMTFLNTPVIWQ